MTESTFECCTLRDVCLSDCWCYGVHCVCRMQSLDRETQRKDTNEQGQQTDREVHSQKI